MEQSIKDKFMSLASRLSPENLAMDGEISRAQIKKRLQQIRREWRELEKQVGRKVYEDELWDY